MRFSIISAILADNLFEMCQFIAGESNLITAEADLYRIESFFELNRIERFLQHLDQKSNRVQFNLTALIATIVSPHFFINFFVGHSDL